MVLERFTCPSCNASIKAETRATARQVLCPKCRSRIEISAVVTARNEPPPIIADRPTVPAPPIQESSIDRGHYNQEVVGESNYQAALVAALSRYHDPDFGSEVVAVMIAEPHNAYDSMAVRIDVRGRTVGYLSRADARAVNRIVEPSLLHAGIPVPGLIRGGFDSFDGVGPLYGIWLDVRDIQSLVAKPIITKPLVADESIESRSKVRNPLMTAVGLSFSAGVIGLIFLMGRGNLESRSSEVKPVGVIDRQFSSWDGSHPNSDRERCERAMIDWVKHSMHDPSSFSLVKVQSEYEIPGYIVTLEFRGKNKLNALVFQRETAKFDLYGKLIP